MTQKITNLAMLRAAADFLQLQGGAEFPFNLNPDDVKVVLDLRDASAPVPTLQIINTTVSIAGLAESFNEMYIPPQGAYAKVLAADLIVDFSAAPAAGNLQVITHNLADAVPNGADNLIPVGGYGLFAPMNTVTNQDRYEVPLGACVTGGSASTPWNAFRGLLFGQNYFPGTPPLGLISRVAYFTSARVSQNFPANTNLITKIALLEYPVGARLVEL